MSWFDSDIAPPAPRNLIWIAAALLSLLVVAISLWPSRAEVSEARVWVRSGESCQYVPATEVGERVACQ